MNTLYLLFRLYTYSYNSVSIYINNGIVDANDKLKNTKIIV